MESNVVEVEKVELVEEADLYHRPARLTRASTIANVIGWVVLAAGIAIFGFYCYYYVSSIVQAGGGIPFASILQAFINPLIYLVVALVLFAVMQWMSEVVYLWMDLEENTRKG